MGAGGGEGGRPLLFVCAVIRVMKGKKMSLVEGEAGFDHVLRAFTRN